MCLFFFHFSPFVFVDVFFKKGSEEAQKAFDWADKTLPKDHRFVIVHGIPSLPYLIEPWLETPTEAKERTVCEFSFYLLLAM